MSGFPEPVLVVEEIQGDGLAGFRKDHGIYLFLLIGNVGQARRWLAWLTPQIATLRKVHRFNQLFRTMRQRSGEPAIDQTWINICFTASGLEALTTAEEVRAFADRPFKVGQKERSAGLGDPTDPNSLGHPDHWIVGGTRSPVDILVIVQGDDRADVDATANAVLEGPGARGLDLVLSQVTATRTDLPGHEHFGFRDGISQPAVRGLMSEDDPDDFLAARILDHKDPRSSTFAAPGQPLVWPGQFIFGERIESGDPEKPEGLAPVSLSPNWIRNGSYVVVRMLRQRVVAFWRFVSKEAAALARRQGFEDLSNVFLAAKLVGRWPSGAPLMRSPVSDDSRVAKGLEANDFDYQDATEPWQLIEGLRDLDPSLPMSMGDILGEVCPHAAHIRKVNPRDESTDLGGQAHTLSRLLIRRGMPFGEPIAEPTNAPASADDEDRGLMFVCYQTSIERQFEFVQKTWANGLLVPKPGGQDPLIGQTVSGTRRFELPSRTGGAALLSLDQPFVIPQGGGYFFAPSIGALRDRLSQQ